MNGFGALARAQWVAFWRDKQNWFWLMAFPLMFLVLFGFLFRDAGASKPTLTQIGSAPHQRPSLTASRLATLKSPSPFSRMVLWTTP